VISIFVGNISYQTTQPDLDSAFAACGNLQRVNVERVNIVANRDTGQRRRFAFVGITEQQAAHADISQWNGAELHGRALNVNKARPKADFRADTF